MAWEFLLQLRSEFNRRKRPLTEQQKPRMSRKGCLVSRQRLIVGSDGQRGVVLSEPSQSSAAPISIGVLGVAIGAIYVDYWKTLTESFLEKSALEKFVRFHIFTDQTATVRDFASKYEGVEFKIYDTPTLPWPFATLNRFEMFEKNISELDDDVLFYLDADMEIAGPLPFETFVSAAHPTPGVLLVQHPGYFRQRSIFSLLRLYLRRPKSFASDIRRLFVEGGHGEWETRHESQAFVPRLHRRRYVCGGTWIAERKSAHEMIREIARRTRSDSRRGVIARWHDESHLNRWAANNLPKIISPSWCFVPNYPNLKGLSPLVIAVEKGDIRTR